MEPSGTPSILGSTGIDIGPIGIGTWAWGDTTGWGFGEAYDRKQVHEAFALAVKRGIKFFDTAEVYGKGASERMLGSFMKGAEQHVLVATKCAPYRYRLLASSLHGALSHSLKRLQRDSVDLYQMHWQTRWVSLERWMDAMAKAADRGRIRAIGVSNYSADQMMWADEALRKHGLRLASNQVEYSLICRAPERNGVAELARELGVTLIAYSPIGMGLLSGKYTVDHMPEWGHRAKYSVQFVQRIQPLTKLLHSIGVNHGGKTPTQVALNWLICKGAFPIPGVKNAAQATEVVGATGWQLDAAEVAELNMVSEQVMK
jgi:aryl-alcohol dehydrogenase-like predicted oxidoreductase